MSGPPGDALSCDHQTAAGRPWSSRAGSGRLDEHGDMASRPCLETGESTDGGPRARQRPTVHGQCIRKADVTRTCNGWNGRLTRTDRPPSYRGGH